MFQFQDRQEFYGLRGKKTISARILEKTGQNSNFTRQSCGSSDIYIYIYINWNCYRYHLHPKNLWSPSPKSFFSPCQASSFGRILGVIWKVTEICHHDLENDFRFNFEEFGVHVVDFKGWSELLDREQPWWINCLQGCSACCHCFAFAQALIAVLNVILINHIDTGQLLTCCKSFRLSSTFQTLTM